MDKLHQSQSRKGRVIALFILFNLILIDLVLRLFVWVGVVPYEKHPTSNAKATYLDDINEVFGVWHFPNAEGRHQTVDFDVTYRSNSYGANDRERSRHSDAERRVVVLGDSYVEAFGMTREERFTDLLEARTGIEHLNFGTNGCFGPVQEWLLYQSLASHFDHTDVFIFMLPFNDFADNEPNGFPADRYRPYLRKTEEGFEVYYPTSFAERGIPKLSTTKIMKNMIDNHWYLANVLRWATRQVKYLKEEPAATRVLDTSSYDRYSALDMERLLFAYEQIIKIAGERRVWLFTIPDVEDFQWAEKQGYDFKLVTALNAFANQHPNVTYCDLLPAFLADAEKHGRKHSDYTFHHDRHWNARGHALAADVVYQRVYSE